MSLESVLDETTARAGAYWVEIRQDERRLGAGFLVTRRLALTAAHCVRDLAEGVPLTIVCDGEEMPAQVDEVLPDADLALIRLLSRPAPVQPPRAGTCRRDEAWFGPYRPSPDDPHLSGSVAHEAVDFRCAGGGTVTALQLTTSAALGDYRGYSGGPVEAGSGGCAVVGILLEQYPDRAGGGRSSNVLFAAALGQALCRFDAFDIAHLIDVIAGRALPSSRKSTTVERAEMLLVALRQWADRGLLEPGEVRKLRMRVVKEVLDD